MTVSKQARKRSPKAAMIYGIASLQQKDLAEIPRRHDIHKSVFYRVVQGETTSSRIDRLIERELGIRDGTLERFGRGNGTAKANI